MMQIVASVAKAAHTCTGTILGASRRTGAIHARAAIYKLATEQGYDRSEVMWYLDRDRTVGYNYEANLAGHLSRNAHFRALCRQAAAEIANHPARAKEEQTRGVSATIPQALLQTDEASGDATPPATTAWRGKLGWSFTAEEVAMARAAICRAARHFEKHTPQQHTPRK